MYTFHTKILRALSHIYRLVTKTNILTVENCNISSPAYFLENFGCLFERYIIPVNNKKKNVKRKDF